MQLHQTSAVGLCGCDSLVYIVYHNCRDCNNNNNMVNFKFEDNNFPVKGLKSEHELRQLVNFHFTLETLFFFLRE